MGNPQSPDNIERLLVMTINRNKQKNTKSFWWHWKRFWGSYYRVYDSNNKLVKEILIYHKKIYLIKES